MTHTPLRMSRLKAPPHRSIKILEMQLRLLRDRKWPSRRHHSELCTIPRRHTWRARSCSREVDRRRADRGGACAGSRSLRCSIEGNSDLRDGMRGPDFRFGAHETRKGGTITRRPSLAQRDRVFTCTCMGMGVRARVSRCWLLAGPRACNRLGRGGAFSFNFLKFWSIWLWNKNIHLYVFVKKRAAHGW